MYVGMQLTGQDLETLRSAVYYKEMASHSLPYVPFSPHHPHLSRFDAEHELFSHFLVSYKAPDAPSIDRFTTGPQCYAH